MARRPTHLLHAFHDKEGDCQVQEVRGCAVSRVRNEDRPQKGRGYKSDKREAAINRRTDEKKRRGCLTFGSRGCRTMPLRKHAPEQFLTVSSRQTV